MRVLVIGSGGREHALGWKIKQSPLLEALYFAPGNAGTAALGENVPLSSDELPALSNWAAENRIDLTVVGPENPLTAGIEEIFSRKGLRLLGPPRRGAMLEGSKAWTKQFCSTHGIPTAAAAVFDSVSGALAYAGAHSFPLVVKADGLAQGKGVVVCASPREAEEAIRGFLERGRAGEAGKKILVEDFLDGEELSAFAIVDGKNICYLGEARDYKRAHDDNRGLNTGGMGSVSTSSLIDAPLRETIRERIFMPALRGLREERISYKGFLYAGLMLTRSGPSLLEFNVRLGDPEAQVLLLRLSEDLLPLLLRAADGTLGPKDAALDSGAAVGVVVAARGYPDAYEKGEALPDLRGLPEDLLIFHASTAYRGGALVNGGGRTLTFAQRAESVEGARLKIYAALNGLKWDRFFFRSDIGAEFSSVVRGTP